MISWDSAAQQLDSLGELKASPKKIVSQTRERRRKPTPRALLPLPVNVPSTQFITSNKESLLNKQSLVATSDLGYFPSYLSSEPDLIRSRRTAKNLDPLAVWNSDFETDFECRQKVQQPAAVAPRPLVDFSHAFNWESGDDEDPTDVPEMLIPEPPVVAPPVPRGIQKRRRTRRFHDVMLDGSEKVYKC